jgi:hypothetical protein
MLLKALAVVAALVLAAGAGAVAVMALDDDPDVVIRETGAPAPAGTPGGDDTDDAPLSADEAERAEAAALRVTGGGEVVELDRSDDPGEAFEVEVVQDGRETDVALDEDFRPVPNRRPDG